MHPLGAERAAPLGDGASREFAFAVADASRCVRVLAAASAGLRALELELVDESGYSYGRESPSGSLALLGPHGPVCVRQSGSYRVLARARAGQGEIAVQLYQVE